MAIQRIKIEDNDKDCTICLDFLGNKTINLDCNHEFHELCIKEIFKNS